MINKKVLILGAGLSGLSTAYHLGKDIDYALYEKENVVGGLCRSVNQDGFLFDYTGHLLHLKDRKIFYLVKSLLKDNLAKKTRDSWIYSKDIFTRYPFQANTYGLPVKVVKECVLGFIEARIKKEQGSARENIFYDWVMANFGKGIGRHFMFGYNEKLWTIPVKELTSEWLAKYVPTPGITEVITGALTDQHKKFGYNSYFWYPKFHGIQSLPNAFAKRLKNVFLSEKAMNINMRQRTVQFATGTIVRYSKLISTIDLPGLLAMTEDLPNEVKEASRRLKYNSVLNINLGIAPALSNTKHWIYFPEKKYPFYRVGFHSNFASTNHPPNTSAMYIEIAHRPGQDQIGNETKGDKIVKQCVDILRRIGLLAANSKVVTVNILLIEPAYCIYDKNRDSSLRMIQNYLKKNGVYSIGRYGAWEYSAMEDAIYWGKITAEKIKIN